MGGNKDSVINSITNIASLSQEFAASTEAQSISEMQKNPTSCYSTLHKINEYSSTSKHGIGNYNIEIQEKKVKRSVLYIFSGGSPIYYRMIRNGQKLPRGTVMNLVNCPEEALKDLKDK